jgi:PIN domain nuclease of toxin-antitoxin system
MRLLLDTHAFLWFLMGDPRLSRTARIRVAHVELVSRLPFFHRDPFDRLLAAQALTEGLPFVSRAPAFDAYGVTRIW